MPASIGVNLRVTGHCRQGGRKYMEDFFSVAYQQTEDEKDLEYAFFGIYDGHGGAEAAAFAKEHLMETIIKHKNFWSDNDEDVLHAIKDGYIATHYAMWREQEKWPKTASGLPSTAGTTASIAFIRRGKMYIGHVGDSGIILGYQEPGSSEWKAKPLTKDHKPENPDEIQRIESCGGKVVSKSGVPRVVWNRPKIGHQGPVRRSTPIDEIPFLAVARSLGDLWSYNSQINQFIVSPDPDCSVIQIDTNVHRCLIFGTDGLYNMLSSQMAVHIVQQAERHNECAALSDATFKTWLNPSKLLVEKALERWQATRMRADNTTVVTLMLDPPGPPRAQVLKDRKKNLPESGLKIMTRYEASTSPQQPQEADCDKFSNSLQSHSETPDHHTSQQCSTKNQNSLESLPNQQFGNTGACCSKSHSVAGCNSGYSEKNIDKAHNSLQLIEHKKSEISSSDVISSNYPLKERNFLPKPRESMSFDPREPEKNASLSDVKPNSKKIEDNTIQINEISSSNIEDNVPEDDTLVESTKTSRPSLRSGRKFVSNETEVKKGIKRKLELDPPLLSSSSVRKSVRISLNVQQQTTKEQEPAKEKPQRNFAPCTVAEEKLKKLAEEAEKVKLKMAAKQTPNEIRPAMIKKRKLSLAQKILKSKKKMSLIDLQKKKRKAAILKPKIKSNKQLAMSKKKIQLVLETISKKSNSLIVNNRKKLLKTKERPVKPEKGGVNVRNKQQKQQPPIEPAKILINNNNITTRLGNKNKNQNLKEEALDKDVQNIENVAKRGNKNKTKKDESPGKKKNDNVGVAESKKSNGVKDNNCNGVGNNNRRSSSRQSRLLSSNNNSCNTAQITKEEGSTKNGLKNSSCAKKQSPAQRSNSNNKTSLRIQQKSAKK